MSLYDQEGVGHRSKCRSSWVVYYSRTVKFLLLKIVKSVNYLRRGASCYVVFTDKAEKMKVIHTVQATGVRLFKGDHDRAPLHPQDIAV